MALEVERKFPDVKLDSLRRKLAEAGAFCLGAHFESNTVFDAQDGSLAATGRLLRLRSQEWKTRLRHVLTLKLPAEVPAGTGQYKVREERDVGVADASAMKHILEGLGYRAVAQYEKIREPWLLDGVEVELDVLPFMEGAELEGEPGAIEAMQRRLGLDKTAMSTKNYHQLHQEWLQRNNLPARRSFVFSEAQRKAWRQQLGLGEENAVPPVSR